MYTQSTPFGNALRHASTYQTVGLETGMDAANPHRLVAMLFEGLFAALHQARGAMRAGQVAAKCAAIGKAVRIVEEGLRGGLNLAEGGELARHLDELYDYALRRLTHANLHNDEAAIEECQQLLQPIKEAWDAIAPQAQAQPRS